jgi:hypothetical protein
VSINEFTNISLPEKNITSFGVAGTVITDVVGVTVPMDTISMNKHTITK